MSDITRLNFEDDEGQTYTMYVESEKIPEVSEISADVDSDDNYESMGISDDIKARLRAAQGKKHPMVT